MAAPARGDVRGEVPPGAGAKAPSGLPLREDREHRQAGSQADQRDDVEVEWTGLIISLITQDILWNVTSEPKR